MISIKPLGICSNVFKIQIWRDTLLKQAPGIQSTKSILWETLPDKFPGFFYEREREKY